MSNFEQEPGSNDPTTALPVPTEQLDLAMVFDCEPEELENLAAYFDHVNTEMKRIEPDPGLMDWTNDEYCWDHDHQGGWSCRDCYKRQHPEEYRQFLDDTVDDAEYNAYLEHRATPRAEDY